MPKETHSQRTKKKADGAAAPAIVDLGDPRLYIDRELSQLEFVRRVLAQAVDPTVPLLERLRFLTICSLVLDEFFEIRVAGLRQRIELGLSDVGLDGQRPRDTLRQISFVAHDIVEQQYQLLRQSFLPELHAQGIRLVFSADWTPKIDGWAKDYFTTSVFPVLTPVGLDPAHPFPMILNKSLNFIVSLKGKDAFGRTSRAAVVQAPRLMPRLIRLPMSISQEPYEFVTLSAMIQANIGSLFPGMKVTGCYPFRVTRNSDLWVDEEEVDDLLRTVRGSLRKRNFGDAVRLEVSGECPEDLTASLLRQFELEDDDLYRVDGPVNLNRLTVLRDLVDRPDLKYPAFVPTVPRVLTAAPDLFAAIRAKDVLLHHPFDSFAPVVQLLQEAAHDPEVLAVKATIYRAGSASPMTEALVEAALNGKDVTAVVELRARFDEEANIDIATQLQNAGVKVVYGIVGFKAHAKMLLIVRRERGQLRRYVHLGTGNYHLENTRSYTDIGLLSSDQDLCEDVHNLFQQLTGLGKVGALKKLVQSPFSLHGRIIELIDREAEFAKRGKPARIRAKMNALVEPAVIQALYRASQAGVKIDLILRGICCLRPGVPGVSENIRVISIVGRFLEHSRVFHFLAGGDDVVLCSSADWMPRNFFFRVEVAFPIEDRELKQRVLHEGIDIYLRDNVDVWRLEPTGEYERVKPADAERCSAQAELLAARRLR